MIRDKNIFKVLLPLFTAAVIAFIWIHSAMPGDTSAAESSFITEFLNGILGENTVNEHLVRKTAHFTEYMLLGILCCMDFAVFGMGGIRYVLFPLYICLAVSVIDESIQLFTVGRSGMLFDVWLDHAGSITGVVCSKIIGYIINREA